MKSAMRIPGLPAPDKQDSVRFHLFKSLSYTTRMMIYLCLILAGFVVQVLTYEIFPGAAALILATLLTLVKGYDSRVRLKNYDFDRNWTEVDMDRIREIKELEKRMKRWDRNMLDISNGLGFITFVAVIVLIIIVANYMDQQLDEGYIIAEIFFWDTVIMIIPLWFNGIQRVLKQGNLRIRIDIVEAMEEHFQGIKQDGETFKPALMLARDKAGKTVPTNARFTIGFEDMPQGFYGIQAQINLNIVQGASYPYFYCVIPAKLGYGLMPFLEKIPKQSNIIVEYQKDKEAEVIVIRQYTTRTSGYHTSIPSCRNIFGHTLYAARLVLGREPVKTDAKSAKKKRRAK